jgi:ubiquinone/menaquinone biosynthesis C-methylase UbiE
MSDKLIEVKRYNDRAQSFLKKNILHSENNLSDPLKVPYIYYKKLISNYSCSSSYILEIGSGMGENTGFLVSTGAKVFATDISRQSLKVISKRFNIDRVITSVADMEKLPFKDELFDIIVSAGSLSYGNHEIVLSEIYRVLKPKGFFIAVDSLGDNPIYRLNRYIHYLRGRRSLSVIKRTPDLDLLETYGKKFGNIETKFFGSISYLTPLLGIFMNEKRITKISNSIDKIFSIKKSAFKFVLIVEKQ